MPKSFTKFNRELAEQNQKGFLEDAIQSLDENFIDSYDKNFDLTIDSELRRLNAIIPDAGMVKNPDEWYKRLSVKLLTFGIVLPNISITNLINDDMPDANSEMEQYRATGDIEIEAKLYPFSKDETPTDSETEAGYEDEFERLTGDRLVLVIYWSNNAGRIGLRPYMTTQFTLDAQEEEELGLGDDEELEDINEDAQWEDAGSALVEQEDEEDDEEMDDEEDEEEDDEESEEQKRAEAEAEREEARRRREADDEEDEEEELEEALDRVLAEAEAVLDNSGMKKIKKALKDIGFKYVGIDKDPAAGGGETYIFSLYGEKIELRIDVNETLIFHAYKRGRGYGKLDDLVAQAIRGALEQQGIKSKYSQREGGLVLDSKGLVVLEQEESLTDDERKMIEEKLQSLDESEMLEEAAKVAVPAKLYDEFQYLEADTLEGSGNPDGKEQFVDAFDNARKTSRGYTIDLSNRKALEYFYNSALPNVLDIAKDKGDRRLASSAQRLLDKHRSSKK